MSSAYCGFCGTSADFRMDGDIDCECGVTVLPDDDDARDAIQTIQDNIQDMDDKTNKALKTLINYINGGGAFQ